MDVEGKKSMVTEKLKRPMTPYPQGELVWNTNPGGVNLNIQNMQTKI